MEEKTESGVLCPENIKLLLNILEDSFGKIDRKIDEMLNMLKN